MNEDKATRYQRLRRRAAVGGTLLTGGLLAALVFSGGAVQLRMVADRITGGATLASAALFVAGIVLANQLLLLPLLHYQGLTLERRYGLSTESSARWWQDYLKASGLGLVVSVAGGTTVAGLLAWTPVWWWLVTAALFSAVLLLFTQVAPVLLLPMFDTTVPLKREALVSRLMTLARRADTRVLGVFEWRVSARTRKANAALTGIGRTRRILLSDTLLAEHSDDEIEVILAHELSHHVHHDIGAALAVEALLILASTWAADAVLTGWAGWLGLDGKADLAGLPVVALTFGSVSLIAMPALNALSRAHERRADRYALDITNNPEAFVSAMRRLGARNLSDERPAPLVERLFHTHPSTASRIAAARAWAERRHASPGPGQRALGGQV